MTLSRLKYLMLLAVGLLAAGPASAATLTVYSTMTGSQMPAADPLFAIGTVTGAPIDCPTNYTSGMAGKVCSASATGTVVLTAASLQNATAVAWIGCPAISGASSEICTVTMGASAVTVQATFKPAVYPLALRTLGPTGFLGYLTTDVGGGDCKTGDLVTHTACKPLAANGATVTVTAVPGAGLKVTNWTGCTSSTAATCTVALTSPKGASATFGPIGIPVTAQINAGGVGTIATAATPVVLDPMDCGADCSAQVTSGGAITLVATPGANSKFKGFVGCAGPGVVTQTCVMTNVTTPRNVSATFHFGGGCNACHAVPPASHVPDWIVVNDCSACHGGIATTGYTSTTVNPALHMTGTRNIITVPAAAPVASLKLAVVSATIPTDGTTAPSVVFNVTDDAGNPLVIGSAAGQVGNPAFHLGKLESDGTYASYFTRGVTGRAYPLVPGTTADTLPVIRNWTGDVTASPSSSASTCTIGAAGCATQAANDTFAASRLVPFPVGAAIPGQYRYTFSKALTITDAAQLHTIALYATRVVSGYNFRASVSIDLAPNGTAVTEREVVSDEACNACHGELTLHGQRRGVKNCLVCHNPGTVDPESGNDVDLARMVHKIHNGALLANHYNIVGYQQTNYEYNHILMAPSHSGYFESTNAAVHDPGLSRECSICHDSTTAAQAGNAFSKPSRRACGSCHDTVDFATGVGHSGGGVQVNDAGCAGCHAVAWTSLAHSRFYEPLTGTDFATLPSMPADGHVFTVDIVEITVAASGRPTVTFDAKLDGTPFDVIAAIEITSTENSTTPKAVTDPLGGRLSTCAFNVAGPTSDYTYPATGGTVSNMGCKTGSSPAVVVNPTLVAVAGTPGRFRIAQASGTGAFQGATAGTFKTGAWNVSYELMYQRQTVTGADTVRKPFSANPGLYTLVNTGTAAAPVWLGTGVGADPLIVRGSGSADDLAYSRRAVVTFDKCNACHIDLGFHSNRSRKGPDYCATCHNPKLDNGTRGRATVAEASFIPGTTQLGYLPESVSMNAFIHRIHMGSALPSVKGTEIGRTTVAAPSPYNPLPGQIVYGATRSGFIGVTDATPPEQADFSEFLMPNPMNRCEQCHIDVGAQQTWALPDAAGKAPVERTYRICTPNASRPTWATEDWCNSASTSGMPTTAAGTVPVPIKVVTPPLKASCTSCHDSAATNAHADLYTINPMTAGATETCASCHGVGKTFDSLLVHRPVP